MKQTRSKEGSREPLIPAERGMNMNLTKDIKKTKKEKNIEKLENIAEWCGDIKLTEMLWSMFADLSETKQRFYIEWAERIATWDSGYSK